MDTQEGKNLPVPHCIKGEHGWEIVDELKDYTKGAKIFDKPTFGSMELAKEIRTFANLKEITLVGYCTDICVVSNALMIKAFNPEIKINVVEKACAGVTEESHNAAITTMKSCQICIN